MENLDLGLRKKPILEGNQESRERILEDAFVNVVQDRILESFSDALFDAGFTADEEHEFRNALATLPLREISGVLSIPHELRDMRLKRLHEQIVAGKTVADVVAMLNLESKEKGYTIGYHMSNADIKRHSEKGQTKWVIDGKEQDHRDNDLPMAYYSTDLAHLYGKKIARYIYIVRADTGKQTTHRQDNDGSWGRATKLDVVDQLDHEAVMEEARERANGSRKK